jgi:hypothetical protein
MQHGLTIFVTGNDLTISEDMRRRFLHIDLFMKEASAVSQRLVE